MPKEIATPEEAAKGPVLPINLPPVETKPPANPEAQSTQAPLSTADSPELVTALGERPEASSRLQDSTGTAPVTADQSAPSATQSGQWFVKNRTNELVTLPDGKTVYKFRKSREFVTDPKIIAGLKAVSNKYQIFLAES